MAFGGMGGGTCNDILGYEAGAVCFAFCRFVTRRAAELKADKVLFVSDSQGALPEIYTRVLGGQCDTVYWSIIADAKYCLDTAQEFSERIIGSPRILNATAENLLTQLDALEYLRTLSEYGISPAAKVGADTKAWASLLQALYPKLKKDVYDCQQKAAAQYLTGLLGDSKRVLIVDATEDGKCAKSLVYYLQHVMRVKTRAYGVSMLDAKAETQENIESFFTADDSGEDGAFLGIFKPLFGFTGFSVGPKLFTLQLSPDYPGALCETLWPTALEFCRHYHRLWKGCDTMLDIPSPAVAPILRHVSAYVNEGGRAL
jgi:hypothetical protein